MNDLQKQWWWPAVLRAVIAPACIHIFLALLGAGGEHSLFMLLATVLAAAMIGSFQQKLNYGPLEAAACAAWPATLAVWRRWHWALNMPSPGGSAQSLVSAMGWPNPSMTAAVTALSAAAGLGGWLFSRWSEMMPRRSRTKNNR